MWNITWAVKASKLCNLRCRYCYEWDDLSNPARMPVEGWARVLTAARRYHDLHAARFGGRYTTAIVWHGGEPLLLPRPYRREGDRSRARRAGHVGSRPPRVRQLRPNKPLLARRGHARSPASRGLRRRRVVRRDLRTSRHNRGPHIRRPSPPEPFADSAAPPDDQGLRRAGQPHVPSPQAGVRRLRGARVAVQRVPADTRPTPRSCGCLARRARDDGGARRSLRILDGTGMQRGSRAPQDVPANGADADDRPRSPALRPQPVGRPRLRRRY